jgi:hypothetical protein
MNIKREFKLDRIMKIGVPGQSDSYSSKIMDEKREIVISISCTGLEDAQSISSSIVNFLNGDVPEADAEKDRKIAELTKIIQDRAK